MREVPSQVLPRKPTMGGVLLQRIIFDRPASLQPLYLRSGAGAVARPIVKDGVLHLPTHIPVSFDTYFNALFEQQWRSFTRLRGLVLDLDAKGDIALRVVRRMPAGDEVTLVERRLKELDGPLAMVLPPAPANPRAAGRLFLELTALTPGATLHAAAWHGTDTLAEPVGLVVVFCTFNREEDLARVLAAMAADAASTGAVKRIVVVNQGRPGLAEHPGLAGLPAALRRRLEVIEQANFGGVGGFTRGMLEAQEAPGATHVLLMDDDVTVEPESLRRAAAFFAIARPGIALGGHMLDLLQPTRLYEAGARINPDTWALEPLHFHLPLDRRTGLDRLQRQEPMHYNGWWMFGLPLAMLEQAGLPLPCFIRGDDMEYGRRLHDQGFFTVSLPGVAVWHEPFYLRLGGWQLYYETRNMLIAAALHFPRSSRGLAVLLLKRLLGQLLTYRYYSAALILRAVSDYLRGPAILEQPPMALHAGLDQIRQRFPPAMMAAEQVMQAARLPPDPHGRAGFFVRLARSLSGNLLRRAPAAPPVVRVPIGDLLWFRVLRHDRIAADTGWDTTLPVFQRDPVACRRLLVEGLGLAARLLRQAVPVQEAWRKAQPHFTSRAFWRSYLELPSLGAGKGAAPPWPASSDADAGLDQPAGTARRGR